MTACSAFVTAAKNGAIKKFAASGFL